MFFSFLEKKRRRKSRLLYNCSLINKIFSEYVQLLIEFKLVNNKAFCVYLQFLACFIKVQVRFEKMLHYKVEMFIIEGLFHFSEQSIFVYMFCKKNCNLTRDAAAMFLGNWIVWIWTATD